MKRVLFQLEAPTVLELGAGSGQLAYDLLLELCQLDCLPQRYQILEVSADLRDRQEALLATLPSEVAVQIDWLVQPPDKDFEGIIFGNEVVDALPVERFTQTEQGELAMEVVTLKNQQLSLSTATMTDAINDAVHSLIDLVEPWALPYRHEIRTELATWLNSFSCHLKRGAMMFVDYGSDRHELYHASRGEGTLLCHYRHRAHDQLLLWPGLQDITAWVDFSLLADAGLDQGWSLDGYLTQAHWLLDAQLDQVIAAIFEEADDVQRLQVAAEAKQLTLPGEMGERFKVISFSRELESGMLSNSHIGLERRL